MAWTAPRNWEDDDVAVPNGIVTAAMLNTDVRDNLLVLSSHSHTGSAGQGGASMSGLTLAALVTLTFADQSANPDAAGELQRNGNDLLWYGSSVVNLTAADASAGTASLRSLSTSSTTAAAGNHTHVPASPNQLIVDAGVYLDTDTESTVATGTIVVQGASEALAVVATFLTPDGSGNTYTLRLKHTGPSSGTIATTTSIGVGATDLHSLPPSGTAGIITPAAAGTFTLLATIERTAGTSGFNPRATVYAREVGA